MTKQHAGWEFALQERQLAEAARVIRAFVNHPSPDSALPPAYSGRGACSYCGHEDQRDHHPDCPKPTAVALLARLEARS